MSSVSLKGTTWGKVDFSQTSLNFNTMDQNPKSIFGVEFQSINNATINKNDIIIETGAEIQNDQDCMCQIRFHVEVPKEENQNQSQQGNQNKMQAEEEQQKKDKASYVSAIYKTIQQKAKIGSFGGQSIVTLNEVNLAVPRGKYTIDFYQKNLRFHGQTYNFLIQYKNIMKGFLLPMENQSQISIILQLHKDRPVYQGQTVYRYILIQVKKDILIQTKTRVKDKDKQKYPHLSQVKDEYSGPLFQVFMDIIRITAQITLIAPDSKDFKSKGGQSCVKCGVKTQSGWLYFLKKSLIFIPKPIVYFKVQEVKKVQFHRLGANNKQFDMKLSLKTQKKSIQFMGLQRNQLQGILEYFKNRQVAVEMQQDPNKKLKADLGDDDDDEQDDEDFNADEQESDDDESGSDEQQSYSSEKKQKKGEKKEED